MREDVASLQTQANELKLEMVNISSDFKDEVIGDNDNKKDGGLSILGDIKDTTKRH